MKSLIWSGIHFFSSVSPGRFNFLNFLLLLLTLLIQQTTLGSSSSTKSNTNKVPLTSCIVCDSLKDFPCGVDENVSLAFEAQCEPSQTWCYKSKGTIYTYLKDGGQDLVEKVDRGCSKPYFNSSVCIHVKQEDGTDFKVCYCDSILCNWNYTVENTTVLNQDDVMVANTASGLWIPPTWLLSLIICAFFHKWSHLQRCRL